MFKHSNVIIVCLLLFSLLSGRGICLTFDPFYLKLLKSGESAFLAQNYPEAIRILEVAAFGLHEERKLAAKAYSILGLCYLLTGEKNKGQESFSNAVGLAGEEGFASLGLSETVQKDLIKVFGPLPDAAKPETTASLEPKEPKTVPQPVSAAPTDSEKIMPLWTKPSEIERPVDPESSLASIYYKRYEAYFQTRNFSAAKKMLQALLQGHPQEYRAYYLLARIEFRQKSYSKALEHFNQSLNPAAATKGAVDYYLKSKIYICLCFFRLNMKSTAAASFKTLQQEFPETEIAAFVKEEGLEASWTLITKKLGEKS